MYQFPGTNTYYYQIQYYYCEGQNRDCWPICLKVTTAQLESDCIIAMVET